MKNNELTNSHEIGFPKIKKQTIGFTLVFVLIFSIIFVINPTQVAHGSEDIKIFGGSGGGGGGGGSCNGVYDLYGLGGEGGKGEKPGYNGGNGGFCNQPFDTNPSGGGGGGGGTSSAGLDADFSTGGAAGTGGNATPGSNGSLGAYSKGGDGGDGANGVDDSRTIDFKVEQLYNHIYVVAGSGGAGGQQMNKYYAGDFCSGAGGDGGQGGSVFLRTSGPSLTSFVKVSVRSGANGKNGSGNGEENGIGGTGGSATYKCEGSLTTPEIFVEKRGGAVDVNIDTVEVKENTVICARGTKSADFVIDYIHVGSRGTLEIDNSNGDLVINSLRIDKGGKVITHSPKSDVAVSTSIKGDTSLTLKKGYKATSTNIYKISGVPEATVTTDNDYGGKITWNNKTKKLDIASGLDVGTYPVKITANNGVNKASTLTFNLTVSDNSNQPVTGDSSKLFIWAILGVLALAGISLNVLEVRRRSN